MKSRPTSPAQHIAQVIQTSDGLFLVRIGDLCQDDSTVNVSGKACTTARYPTACASQLDINLQVSVESQDHRDCHTSDTPARIAGQQLLKALFWAYQSGSLS